MIEVFMTNIPNKNQAVDIITTLENNFPTLKISFDIERTIINYPYDHSILRVEGNTIEVEDFMSAINKLGFECDIL
ncbi:hypothetical protein OOZ15_00315 [Galbibacter sp. EGI 63066]|uniref:hypothetical protein n=1 Tax=Galbibacter sp. EGI 63066 TaxID=2993559 RepID=UPI0022489C2E|nr:hypothetical protein [Galbibacter sp. EGI 63066]MCX2678372.1 hypothetical protein [Galbibacter sp. EGI 63066]